MQLQEILVLGLPCSLAGLTIRTSRITLPHLFQELMSVSITPPITPNDFWGFNKHNSQAKLHHLVLSLLGRNTWPTPSFTPENSQGINWRN